MLTLGSSCHHGNDVQQIYHNAVTGEFSLAVTDCQKYLNGGFADPYVPPDAKPETCAYYNSDFSSFPVEYKEFLKSFFLAQIDGYEKGERGLGKNMVREFRVIESNIISRLFFTSQSRAV